ncbi:chemotaxis protein [Massilia sp. JS1662]|nr:methyl-accepting chemotaxis protein [Massilia sp. JS1662]KGF83462.1 chemotaxis protein [Massilia sp. JS1662]
MNFLKRIGIATQLYVAFALILSVTLIVSVLSVTRVNSIDGALQKANTVRNSELEPLYAAREALAQTGIAARNAFVFKDDAASARELALVDSFKADYLAALGKLDAVLADDAQYARVKAGMMKMATELERPRAYRTAGNMEGYGQFLVQECSPLRRQIVADMDVLLKRIQQDNAATSAAASLEAKGARWWITVLSVVSVVLCAVVGVVIVRSLITQLGGEPAQATEVAHAIASGQLTCHVDVSRAGPSSMIHAMNAMRHGLSGIVAKVRTGTETIASASSQIASGNNDLSSRTETQAATLQQVTGAMAQLVASVHQNADYARQASALATTASTVSVEGGAAVDQVVATMHLIEESSRKIVDIISVIDGIAFQTNILALNAAVEAARAGEQGRGFAVVAGEVRNLAHRSAAAAKEIKALIEDSVAKVGAGTSLVGHAGETIRKVVDGVQRVSEIMDRISGATRSQQADIGRVDSAISHLDEMTMQNASLVEEAAAAAESLRMQAVELSAVVNIFQIEEAAPNRQRRLAA